MLGKGWRRVDRNELRRIISLKKLVTQIKKYLLRSFKKDISVGAGKYKPQWAI